VTEQARIPGTQVHQIESKAVGDSFEISIFKPEGIDEPLPVIYSTDANNSFGSAANAVNMMILGDEIPPVLLVGVGYRIGGDFLDRVFSCAPKHQD